MKNRSHFGTSFICVFGIPKPHHTTEDSKTCRKAEGTSEEDKGKGQDKDVVPVEAAVVGLAAAKDRVSVAYASVPNADTGRNIKEVCNVTTSCAQNATRP